MSSLFSLLAAVLSFLYAFPLAAAFTFSFSQPPSQCDNLPITWSGGTPPFQLSIIHLFGTQRNVSIPTSAFNNGQGSYSVQIPLAKGEQMMLMMSDATGFNTGGTSNILNVAASQGGSCNTTDPGISFSYQLNTALQQCRPFTFSDYTGAVQPVTISAIIPGGNAFLLSPPVGPTSFDWNAAVARGTSVVFVMTDSQGRAGGVSDIEIITSSDDSSCLNSNSPSSTASPPSTPTTSTPTTTSTSGAANPSSTADPSHGFSIAAIAGTVIGGLLFLALAITLGLFFLHKKRDANNSANNFRRHSRIVDPGMDLAYNPGSGPGAPPYGIPPPGSHHTPASSYPYSSGGTAANPSDPFLDSHSTSIPGTVRSQVPIQFDAASMYTDAQYPHSEAGTFEMPSQYQYGPSPSQTQLYPPSARNHPPPNGTIDPFSPTITASTEYDSFGSHSRSQSQSQSMPQGSAVNRTSTSTSTAQRKAAAAGMTAYKPSRYILHTDVEDALPPTVEDEEVIELPPQYSERRVPGSAPPPIPPSSAHAGHPPGEESLLPY
ncbi:hypothetical protein HYPSUDRAFT_516676 [Hypholoma sublateritium FD-334 SS-4]|uniref:Mid2 domain-containing protein n=1 Tax=Hypholoma sublateritium (strain FD-334 SS-4) TaxID=945553 RepID=A0A0D2PM59_HYPSF|nr:hypothetical protein HYPSUDRAFT_516676 [Hypholoma sublateritium FD-334 SS-4]